MLTAQDAARLEIVRTEAERFVARAAAWGVVVTIEQKPLEPLAMGHYKTVVSVREVRK